VFENTQGYQFLSFNISRLGTGTFEGPVTFYVTMDMAGYRATFQIDAMVHLGPHDIALLHGARVHSVPGPPPPITAQLDIRPGECPNVFNPKSQGRVAMALVGSPTLNVRDIELASVRLNGFMPLRTAFLDVARAFSTIPCECADGVDGVEDLSLRFASEDVAAAIGPTAPGSVTTLTVTGLLTNGAPFEASDCLHIVGPPPRDSIPPDSVVARMFVRRGASRGAAQIEYTLAADADVDLDVYDVTGRHLESLVQTRQQSGEHQVEWRAENMRQGVYFFRLTAAGQMQMRRFVLLR
jgi:hypothetical protein